jgi:hypothetical protein
MDGSRPSFVMADTAAADGSARQRGTQQRVATRAAVKIAATSRANGFPVHLRGMLCIGDFACHSLCGSTRAAASLELAVAKGLLAVAQDNDSGSCGCRRRPPPGLMLLGLSTAAFAAINGFGGKQGEPCSGAAAEAAVAVGAATVAVGSGGFFCASVCAHTTATPSLRGCGWRLFCGTSSSHAVSSVVVLQ